MIAIVAPTFNSSPSAARIDSIRPETGDSSSSIRLLGLDLDEPVRPRDGIALAFQPAEDGAVSISAARDGSFSSYVTTLDAIPPW